MKKEDRQVVVLTLATARLTRFITTDWLGEWLIDAGLRRWANSREMHQVIPWTREELESPVEPENGWRSKMVSGLDCPACVGFWIGLAMLLTQPLWNRFWLTRRVVEALALNYVVAHLSHRLD